MPTPIPVTAGF